MTNSLEIITPSLRILINSNNFAIKILRTESFAHLLKGHPLCCAWCPYICGVECVKRPPPPRLEGSGLDAPVPCTLIQVCCAKRQRSDLRDDSEFHTHQMQVWALRFRQCKRSKVLLPCFRLRINFLDFLVCLKLQQMSSGHSVKEEKEDTWRWWCFPPQESCCLGPASC